jgi:hypothetical protein
MTKLGHLDAMLGSNMVPPLGPLISDSKEFKFYFIMAKVGNFDANLGVILNYSS